MKARHDDALALHALRVCIWRDAVPAWCDVGHNVLPAARCRLATRPLGCWAGSLRQASVCSAARTSSTMQVGAWHTALVGTGGLHAGPGTDALAGASAACSILGHTWVYLGILGYTWVSVGGFVRHADAHNMVACCMASADGPCLLYSLPLSRPHAGGSCRGHMVGGNVAGRRLWRRRLFPAGPLCSPAGRRHRWVGAAAAAAAAAAVVESAVDYLRARLGQSLTRPTASSACLNTGQQLGRSFRWRLGGHRPNVASSSCTANYLGKRYAGDCSSVRLHPLARPVCPVC